MEVKIYNYSYNSKIKDYITSFVSQKRNAGYPYNSSARILKVFDEMIINNFSNETTITKEMIDFWIAYKPGEHPNGLLRRMTPIRQLSIYIKYFDDSCYVVPGHPAPAAAVLRHGGGHQVRRHRRRVHFAPPGNGGGAGSSLAGGALLPV